MCGVCCWEKVQKNTEKLVYYVQIQLYLKIWIYRFYFIKIVII